MAQRRYHKASVQGAITTGGFLVVSTAMPVWSNSPGPDIQLVLEFGDQLSAGGGSESPTQEADACCRNASVCWDDSHYLVCGNFDADPFTEWNDELLHCSLGQHCQKGLCIPLDRTAFSRSALSNPPNN